MTGDGKSCLGHRELQEENMIQACKRKSTGERTLKRVTASGVGNEGLYIVLDDDSAPCGRCN